MAESVSLRQTVQSMIGEVDNDFERLKRVRELKSAVQQDIDDLKSQIRSIYDEIDAIDAVEAKADEEEDAGRKAVDIRTIRDAFNEKPKKGIAMLLESDDCDGSPDAVAKFLFETKGISKVAVGDYIGEVDDFNQNVLEAFVRQHKLEGVDFDKALRAFLWSFHLPGESQKIDRIMEKFAAHFHACNPEIFANADAGYVLAFATIMLNTSIHNPNIKEKMTLEQFISMNRGINDGKDLDSDFLTELYQNIKSRAFDIPEDGVGMQDTFVDSQRCGWLVKEGGRNKNWRRRYFKLANNCLYYFENDEVNTPKGTIPLENLIVRELSDHRRPYCFELLGDGRNDSVKGAKLKQGRIVQGKHQSYKMSASSAEDMRAWIAAIRGAMTKDPITELFKRKRANLAPAAAQ